MDWFVVGLGSPFLMAFLMVVVLGRRVLNDQQKVMTEASRRLRLRQRGFPSSLNQYKRRRLQRVGAVALVRGLSK